MNKKLWIIGVSVAVLIVFLIAAGVVGFFAWRYMEQRSALDQQRAAFSDNSFRNHSIELPRGLRHAEKRPELISDEPHVISVERNGTMHIGHATFPRSGSTRFKAILDTLGLKTSEERKGTTVYVALDKRANHEITLEILEDLFTNSMGKVAFITGKSNDDDSSPGYFSIELNTLSKFSMPKNIPGMEFLDKPDPLKLVLSMSRDREIELNAVRIGTASDLSQATVKLSQIFKDRANNGVFRSQSAKIEKTVHIKASKSVQHDDVMRLIDAARAAGASPIILQMADLYDF